MISAELAERRKAGTLKFGYCVPAFAMPGPDLFRVPNVARIENVDVLGNARDAERLGFDSLWVCDHLMLGRDKAVLEGWTTLAMIAGATTKAQLGLIHQANLFRMPQIAAKMMSTLDLLSGGRFIHFFEAKYFDFQRQVLNPSVGARGGNNYFRKFFFLWCQFNGQFSSCIWNCDSDERSCVFVRSSFKFSSILLLCTNNDSSFHGFQR